MEHGRSAATLRTAVIARQLLPACSPAAAQAEQGQQDKEKPPTSPVRQASGSGREFVIGPHYRASREVMAGQSVEAGGEVHPRKMRSEDSQIYPGVAKDTAAIKQLPKECFTPFLNCPPGATLSKSEVVPYERELAVYVPRGNDATVPAPFIVLNDGMGYVDTVVPCLNTLIAEKRVPENLCAIFLNSGGSDAQGSQRGLEYDAVDGVFAEFLDSEVVPFVEASLGISLTQDPEGRATLGGSSGASCAFSCAWFRPDLFRRVISYSGTFVNQQAPYNPETPTGCWEYHSGSMIIQNTSPAKPLKIALFNPTKDNGSELADETFHNWTTANYRMAAALREMGYDYQHTVCEDAGHVDRRVVAQTVAGALEWLWADYDPRR